MKNQSIQENTEGEKDNKKKSFGEDPEQAQYKRSM